MTKYPFVIFLFSSMEYGIYPIIKAGVPDITLPYDSHLSSTPAPLWLRIGEKLPLGTNVYDLQPTDGYSACQNIPIFELIRAYPYDLSKPASDYSHKLKETPVAFAGRTVLNGERVNTAGILFRSGFRLGWVNIHPPR